MTTAAKPRALVVRELRLADVRDNPDNPRGKIEPGSVAELAKSIEELGLLEPIIVREIAKGGAFELAAGHRRRAAFALLKRETIPAFVLEESDATDERSIAIMLADNLHHVAPDPVRESIVIAALRKTGDLSLDDLSARLGRSRKWVAERLAISELPVEILKKTVGAREPWSLEATIELARVGPDRAASMLNTDFRNWKPRASQVRERIESSLRSLSKVSWNLNDEKIVPAAGSCSKCPKTTLRREALFATTDAKDLGRCLDSKCFELKTVAATKRKLEDEKARLVADKDNRPVLAAQGEWSGGRMQAPEGLQVVPEHRWSTKSVKGAKPARLLVVEGKGAGKLVDGFVLPHGVDATVSGRPAKKTLSELTPKEQEKARAASRERRAIARAIDRVGIELEAWAKSDKPKLEPAAAIFALDSHHGWWGFGSYDGGGKLSKAVESGPDELARFLARSVVDGIKRRLTYRTGDAIKGVAKVASFIAKRIGFDFNKACNEERDALDPVKRKLAKAKAVKS